MRNDKANLLSRFELLYQLQKMGHLINGIFNKHTGRFDENLISVNDLLVYVMPVDTDLTFVSPIVLDESDLIIAIHLNGGLPQYYIIPTEHISQKQPYVSFKYEEYHNAWNNLKLYGASNECL